VLRVAFWGTLLLASARLGAWAVGSRLRSLAHLAWDGPVGLALVVGALLGIGLLPSGFRAPVIGAVLAGAVLVAAVRAGLEGCRRFAPGGMGPWGFAMVGLVVAVGAAGLIWDRVPPVFFDTLAYHFAQPMLWLVEGRIAPETWSLHSWFPPGMSVLYGAGLALGGEALASDANLLLGLVLLLVAREVGRRLWGEAAGLAAALCAVALPGIAYALAIPAADLGHGTFVLGSIGALLVMEREPEESERAAWRRRAGWLAGGACLTKYIGLLVPLSLGGLWLLLTRAGEREPRERAIRLRRAVAFSVPAMLFLSPWLVANTLAVGNPVAPALWTTRGLAAGGAERFLADARGGLPGVADLERLVPRLVTGDAEESRIYPTPAWGWLPLAALPAILLSIGANRPLRRTLGMVAVMFGTWLVTFRWERFLVGCSALLAVAMAGALALAWRRGGVYRGLTLAAALVGLAGAAQAARTVATFTGGLPVALGLEAPREHLERVFPAFRLYGRASERLEPGRDRALVLGEMRHYGLRVPHAAPTGFNVHPLAELLEHGATPGKASAGLRARGFTHLIVDPGWVRASAARYPSLAVFHSRPELLEECLRSLGDPLAVDGSVRLYRIPG
jgi:hypothetical protein